MGEIILTDIQMKHKSDTEFRMKIEDYHMLVCSIQSPGSVLAYDSFGFDFVAASFLSLSLCPVMLEFC